MLLRHQCRSLCAASGQNSLKRTPLYDWHFSQKGKMVGFCGWELPVMYEKGVKAEHLHTRSAASLFDVSHMGQVVVEGADRVAFLESQVVSDLAELGEGSAKLSLLTTADGGIMDDCVITKYADHLYVVVNAGNRDKDLAHLFARASEFGGDVRLRVLEERALLALQGPAAAEALQALLPAAVRGALPVLGFMNGLDGVEVGGLDGRCRLTRCGYTGEDGFEISVEASEAARLASRLLDGGAGVRPAGLGARDSLRLEAGLCLWGNDIDEGTGPAEAGLNWTVGARRRQEGGFPGAERIMAQCGKAGLAAVPRRRVGLRVEAGVVRPPAAIFDGAGETEVGHVTSGSFAPSLNAAIAMAYVPKDLAKPGTRLKAAMRGKKVDVVVTKMPFVEAHYYK